MKIQTKNIIAILLIAVLSIFLFPQTVRTVMYLNMTWWTEIQKNGLVSLSSEFVTARSGEYVLPPPVQAILAMLRAQNVNTYRYSQRIRQDEEIRQRLIEGAYPILFSENAPFLVHFADEPIAKTCQPVTSMRGAALAYCP